MHTQTAYERRENLSENELVRLKSALIDEVERYTVGIRGYDEDKMTRYGEPFLRRLQERVDVVSALLSQKLASNDGPS